MHPYLRAGLKLTLPFALSLLLAGCFLRSLFGNVIITTNVAEETIEIIETVFSDGTAAVCLGTDFGFYECTYIVGGDILTSTLYLLSELGLAGVLVDPLIAQVPADAANVVATYDLGSGPQPLFVQQTQRFNVTPSLSVTAESGQKFLILELPAGVEAQLPGGDPAGGLPLSYTLTFSHTEPLGPPVGPQTVKLMAAGRVTLNGYNYYVPILPCVADFALIPPLTLPAAATPQDLQPALRDLLIASPNALCDHEAYSFANVPPPLPPRLYLPLLMHPGP